MGKARCPPVRKGPLVQGIARGLSDLAQVRAVAADGPVAASEDSMHEFEQGKAVTWAISFEPRLFANLSFRENDP